MHYLVVYGIVIFVNVHYLLWIGVFVMFFFICYRVIHNIIVLFMGSVIEYYIIFLFCLWDLLQIVYCGRLPWSGWNPCWGRPRTLRQWNVNDLYVYHIHYLTTLGLYLNQYYMYMCLTKSYKHHRFVELWRFKLYNHSKFLAREYCKKTVVTIILRNCRRVL